MYIEHLGGLNTFPFDICVIDGSKEVLLCYLGVNHNALGEETSCTPGAACCIHTLTYP